MTLKIESCDRSGQSFTDNPQYKLSVKLTPKSNLSATIEKSNGEKIMISDRQQWLETAQTEFNMTVKDSARLYQLSKLIHRLDIISTNDRELTDTEKLVEWQYIKEVKKICDRYSIKQSDGNTVGYEYPDPRSGSGLRFILPSGKTNSWGGYNL